LKHFKIMIIKGW